jgi:hypothetical protein
MYTVETNQEADELIASLTMPDAAEVLKIAEQFNEFIFGKTYSK